MKKKFLSLLLALAMCLSLGVPAWASKTANTLTANNISSKYDSYTLDLETYQKNLDVERDILSTKSEQLKAIPNEDIVSYVKSLNLSEKGFSFVETECLNQLKEYEDAGIELTSYTVLTPKTRSDDVFGEYNGRTYYSTFVSISYPNVEITNTPSQSTLDSFANLLLDFFISCGGDIIAIPFSVIRAAFDITEANVTLQYGSEFLTSFLFAPVSRRVIYTYANSAQTVEKTVFRDECGAVQVELYFKPVGAGFGHAYQLVAEKPYCEVQTKYYDNTSYILSRCHVMYNHNSVESWYLTQYVTSSDWFSDYWA